VDSRDSVFDISFSPRHLGLKLATCSGDGFVRIYEAIDVINLAHWPLMEEFEAEKRGANSISWCSSPFERPMLAVGSNETVAKVWEYNDKLRRWQVVARLDTHTGAVHDVAWAPNLGRSFHLIATASYDTCVRIFKLAKDASNAEPSGETPGNIGAGNATGAAADDSSSSTAVAGTAAAAAASSSSSSSSAAATTDASGWTVRELASFDDHKAEVWRVEWNVTGSTLASSGDDGAVRLFKANLLGQWGALSVISGEQ
jgi:nucleoporin SEH1